MELPELTVDPNKLRVEALREPSRRGLEDYSDTIRVLKEEKGFSFREIAVWLKQRGLQSDHNAVWRAYSKTVPKLSASDSYERNERNEQRTAHSDAMPWLEGS
jgi:hypothetical protein